MRVLSERLENVSSRLGGMPSEEALRLLDDLAPALRAALAAPDAEAHRLFASAKTALHGLPLDVLSIARVEALQLSAQFAYVSGQPFAGLDHARLAVECARRLNDRSALRKALTFHGILLADTGNIPRSSVTRRHSSWPSFCTTCGPRPRSGLTSARHLATQGSWTTR